MSTPRSQLRPNSAAFVQSNHARRRRPLARQALLNPIAWTSTAADEPAQDVLRNTLNSACEVIGASRGFVLLLRDDTKLEVSCARNLQPFELLDIVLGPQARTLYRALADAAVSLADGDGNSLPFQAKQNIRPAVVAMPLELGSGYRGALCLLNSEPTRTLSSLDLEILGALSEQASLAVRAANQHSALRQLAARLTNLTAVPA